ncbi:MAG: GDSL-type esterase/lipase family protein [Muribaculaceae bacterium]|nr:GDSL-type esterase/lipase family protein [Muribaculaceae bacterium]
MNDNTSSSQKLLTVVGLALGLLLCLSALPLSELTGNVLKDFDLFEDLFPAEHKVVPVSESMIDPQLEEFLATAASQPEGASQPTPEQAPAATADSTSADTTASPIQPSPRIVEGKALIESYLPSGEMLPRFKAALVEAADRVVRVGVIGDSFIEGDIITQDLRELLQAKYGGSGVGFMALHSDIPGFRKSVRQTDQGWTMHDIRALKKSDTLRTLSGDYAVASAGARSTFKGVAHKAHAADWSASSLLLIAPAGGEVTLAIDGVERTVALDTTSAPQCVRLDGPTAKFELRGLPAGAKALGAYLDGATGVQVDCMPIRGNSGVGHARLNKSLAQKMRRWIDYDLIIVEYGINALSADQRDYSPYGKALAAVASHLRSAYPRADILILGISDRGSKNGTTISSLPTCDAMVKAQRCAAASVGVHFWDTRAAMGGAGSCADWRKRKLMNADYVHLNHDGGAELASLLFDALTTAANE